MAFFWLNIFALQLAVLHASIAPATAVEAPDLRVARKSLLRQEDVPETSQADRADARKDQVATADKILTSQENSSGTVSSSDEKSGQAFAKVQQLETDVAKLKTLADSQTQGLAKVKQLEGEVAKLKKLALSQEQVKSAKTENNRKQIEKDAKPASACHNSNWNCSIIVRF